jgi:hypothetical protein
MALWDVPISKTIIGLIEIGSGGQILGEKPKILVFTLGLAI